MLQSTVNSVINSAHQLATFEGELILDTTDGQAVSLLVIKEPAQHLHTRNTHKIVLCQSSLSEHLSH